MNKHEYESPQLVIIPLDEDDVIRTSAPDVGVDGSEQQGWWGTN